MHIFNIVVGGLMLCTGLLGFLMSLGAIRGLLESSEFRTSIILKYGFGPTMALIGILELFDLW